MDRRTGCARQHLRPRTPLGAWWERGAKAQAIGPSRGGQTTKVHVLAAVPGRLRRLVAGRGYEPNALRRNLRAKGTKPVIPGRRCRKRAIRHDERRYRDRWRIEAAICRLRDFRRVGTRYDKLAANFESAVALAAIIAFWC